MDKKLPVWLFLLALLIGSLLAILFGWFVKGTVGGYAAFGKLGAISVAVSTFPDMVLNSFHYMTQPPEEFYRVPQIDVDLSEFRAAQIETGINVRGLIVRKDEASLTRASGWRVVVGKFTIGHEVVQSALVLSPELNVVKVWEFRNEFVSGQKPRGTARTLIHGFVVLKDGSVIFATEGGGSIQRIDKCGKPLWSNSEDFSHAVSLDENEKYAWTVNNADENNEVVQVATQTGEIVRRISMRDIIAANPMIGILEIMHVESGRVMRKNSRDPVADLFWRADPFHINDVEPLPAAFSGEFEGFEAGDLLLSVRSLNLIFVVDPDSLEVKWWYSGSLQRQHDPDWQPTGEITVFDNRLGRSYSRIVSINPVTKRIRTLFDGSSNDFYSSIQGKHQVTKAGNILIASASQGRVFEVDPDGRLVFDMLSTDPESYEFNYRITDALWFPVEDFDLEDFACSAVSNTGKR